ncbi:MAG: hypothetical protein K2L97_08200 [Muribaculaceae bacterium]|nr:hypothetical protein [Muribaculaceae bacterium]
MNLKFHLIAIGLLMAAVALSSCTTGQNVRRDRNLEQALLARVDTVPYVEYVGMSDVSNNNDHTCSAVIIYYVTDKDGVKTERNARVTANEDCSEIYAWEDLDTQILDSVKQQMTDRFEENGISVDGSIIDNIIKLKRLTR